MSLVNKVRMKEYNGVDYDIIHPETESGVITDKGLANGVASLNENGKIPNEQINNYTKDEILDSAKSVYNTDTPDATVLAIKTLLNGKKNINANTGIGTFSGILNQTASSGYSYTTMPHLPVFLILTSDGKNNFNSGYFNNGNGFIVNEINGWYVSVSGRTITAYAEAGAGYYGGYRYFGIYNL